MSTVDAIVLAGGRATRMGGVDKPGLVVGGQSMLESALAAVASCARTVVVGPRRPELNSAIRQVQEIPAGAGPVAAVASGLRALADCDFPAGLVVVLAADLPFLTAAAVDDLVAQATASGVDAVFAADEAGRPQYLVGAWRATALRDAVDSLDTLVNQPMKALVPADTLMVPVGGVTDCDTPDEVRRARAQAAPVELDEARNLVRRTLTPVPDRETNVRSALGGVLAEPLVAAEALPRFDVSAMDGYAVSGPSPWRLRRDVGFAGGERPIGLLPGEAVRIATGAHVPEGTERVLRDEFSRIEDELLHQLPDTPEREDVRRRGEDWLPGDEIAPAGTPVTAAVVSVAAAAEVGSVRVRGPIRARIVMTGDEIRGEGPLHPGQTRDSIGPVLPILAAALGISAVERVHLRDTAGAFDELLSAAADCDLIVIVGATGGGAADQLRDALDRTGARLLVQRLRMRPGGSTIIAETRSGTAVLGLPGNPYAAVATLLALGPALVDGLTARLPTRRRTVALRNAGTVSEQVPRIVPVHAVDDGWVGDPQVRTAHLAALLNRDGLVIVPPGLTDGAEVEFIPLPG
ncbi:NTP transferase domain-containing protein [Nocardia stercoris]|uniref:Molybdopterin molybdenumtransferase n=1 Tax=Nocardia stercoris TaxID=2483361 RepID=A0A3M2LDT2_9NOCA|nr:NTP transferase domain-containing protein [Nocardia stercoris]RMI35186.1 molybdenum cofactor biosynthesis protein [Nocardia stercoris]